MSAREALETMKRGDPRGWAFGATQIEYDRAVSILAALVNECEARDSDEPDSYATWRAAYNTRRRLERGEES